MSNRYRNLRRITPYLCHRAGGRWCGWTGERCVGARCEICGRYLPDVVGARAHINERKGDRDDTIENIIVACTDCHDHDAFPDGGLSIGTEKALELVKRKNERMEET